MKPIKTWDEAQSEIQKQMGEIIKAVWDAGVKTERKRIIEELKQIYRQWRNDVDGGFLISEFQRRQEEVNND